MIAEWIVIIAMSSGPTMSLSVPATFTLSSGSIPAIYTPPAPPPPPMIVVVKANSKASAEDQARGYYVGATGSMWTDEKLAAPGLWSPSQSRSVVIIAPDGKVYRVESVERKKKVVREVEESDGWEMQWTEAP